MTENIKIAGNTWNSVPSINVPTATGGTASFVAISDTTAAASDVADGKVFYTANGTRTTGTNTGGGGGATKNVQAYIGYQSGASTSYTATSVSLTVAKTGTYRVSWMGWRSSSSGTNGSQLYIGTSAYGSANTTFTNTYGQAVTLNNVSLTQGQTITVRARSRSTSYYMIVGNLIIEEV